MQFWQKSKTVSKFNFTFPTLFYKTYINTLPAPEVSSFKPLNPRGAELRNYYFSSTIMLAAAENADITSKLAILPNRCHPFVDVILFPT